MSADRSLEFEIQIFGSNNSSECVEKFGNAINFVTLPRKVHVPLQPETIAFYIVFLVMLETVGNFLLYCIIVYEKYGMDTQKRTLTNQLLRCEIFGFFLLLFPQNERKIYKFCSVSFAQFVYFLREVCLLFNC